MDRSYKNRSFDLRSQIRSSKNNEKSCRSDRYDQNEGNDRFDRNNNRFDRKDDQNDQHGAKYGQRDRYDQNDRYTHNDRYDQNDRYNRNKNTNRDNQSSTTHTPYTRSSNHKPYQTAQNYQRSETTRSNQTYQKPIKTGPLYFHHIFDRDGLNHQNKPILTDVFTAPKQILLIDGEKCLNRLFGGGFQEYWTSGVTDETLDMLRNMDLYAHSKNCFIVIAFQGRLVDPDFEKDFSGIKRKNEFFQSQKLLSATSMKSLGKQGNSSNFVVPTGFRHFVNSFDFHSLKTVYTDGDHVETICRWLSEGLPNEVFTDSFKTKNFKHESVKKNPDILMGYENEYILFLMNQKKIRYFMSSTLVLGQKSPTSDIPNRFKACCIIPDHIPPESNIELPELALCSILLDGDSEHFENSMMEKFHCKMAKENYEDLQNTRKSNNFMNHQRMLEILSYDRKKLDCLCSEIRDMVPESFEDLTQVVRKVIFGNTISQKTAETGFKSAVSRLETILKMKDNNIQIIPTNLSIRNLKISDKTKKDSDYMSDTESAESGLYSNSVGSRRDLLYPIIYEFDTEINCDKTLKSVFELCKKGELHPMIYQAMSLGEVYLNTGGVWNFSSEKLLNPFKVFTPIREYIYSLVFPSSMLSDIRVVEYFVDSGAKVRRHVRTSDSEYGDSKKLSTEKLDEKNFAHEIIVKPGDIAFTEELLIERKNRGFGFEDLIKKFKLKIDLSKIEKKYWDIVIILKFIQQQTHNSLLKSEVKAAVATYANGPMYDKNKSFGFNSRESHKQSDPFHTVSSSLALDRIQWTSTLIHQGFFHFGVLSELLCMNGRGEEKFFRPISCKNKVCFNGRHFRLNCQNDCRGLKAGLTGVVDKVMKVMEELE